MSPGCILLGPAGVPDAVVRRPDEAVNRMLVAPVRVERLSRRSAEPLVGAPWNVTALVVGDRDKWRLVIREAHFRPD